MSTAIIVLISGLVISVGAFAYAGRNMHKALFDEADLNGDGFLKDFIGAIIVMAVGGLVATVGLILWITDLVTK